MEGCERFGFGEGGFSEGGLVEQEEGVDGGSACGGIAGGEGVGEGFEVVRGDFLTEPAFGGDGGVGGGGGFVIFLRAAAGFAQPGEGIAIEG